MFSSVLSAAILGMEVCPVRVEADVNDGLPSFSMVGYVSSQVREAQDRVRTALRNMQIALPPRKIVVNLAPADIRKEGAGFDLPVAAAVLGAMGYLPRQSVKDVLMLGELSLSGEVRGVSGVLPIVMKAREMGYKACVIPQENEREGRLVSGIPVIGVSSLEEMIQVCSAYDSWQETADEWKWEEEEPVYDVDFADIRGQETVKRAAVISASGLHNLLMIGSPGAGKTMIARRIPTIMPMLTPEESLEITKIYSIAGLLPSDKPVIRVRPFRSPHHTASPQALAGGGRIPRPGEVTLAHRAVLFLDELPEFSRASLEILRQPLEEKCIHLSRVHGVYTFPAAACVIGGMNPCPCGYFPDRNRCTCTEIDVRKYLHRISQALLDRIDLCTEVPAVTWEEMNDASKGQTSAEVRELVTRTQQIQRERYKGTELVYNSDLCSRDIEKYCIVNEKGKKLIEQAFSRLSLSVRGYHRTLKVARTIADLEEADCITENHISEALAFRMIDKKYWGI